MNVGDGRFESASWALRLRPRELWGSVQGLCFRKPQMLPWLPSVACLGLGGLSYFQL